ncbi:MAG: HPF/RaiA family ribosome-associated protein [Deltaproteobacteria bacterium]|nr:HPF/RaiA family ribosome-associated protein [Deltaproteobacteria bacterium]MBW2421064.1 HPF/RaiA family ribosome-associated protein [Deltaproteobacteria bacterium]
MRVRIRGPRTELTDQLRDLVHRRAGFTMGRFAGAIREVNVLLAESGEAAVHERIRCSVRVRLARGNRVKVVQAGGEVSTAVDAALERAAREVQRQLELERLVGRRANQEEPDET